MDVVGCFQIPPNTVTVKGGSSCLVMLAFTYLLFRLSTSFFPFNVKLNLIKAQIMLVSQVFKELRLLFRKQEFAQTTNKLRSCQNVKITI